jgi:transposase-like protein
LDALGIGFVRAALRFWTARLARVDECPKKSGYRFSPRVGTVFENTNYKLPLWFEVIYLITQSKKGMSALQVQRMLKENNQPTAYKTAFYMCHRIRAMLDNDQFSKLLGVVEIDETFIGGKEKNKHLGKRNRHNTAGVGKTIVIGAISRKGNVTCQMIEHADRETMMGFVRKTVDRNVQLVVTDEHAGYNTMADSGRAHEVVKHGEQEYVRGIVHTNSIESFWSLLKRGIMGTYHNVSAKYLPLYLNEFQWRFNNRNNPNIFFDAIGGC